MPFAASICFLHFGSSGHLPNVLNLMGAGIRYAQQMRRTQSQLAATLLVASAFWGCAPGVAGNSCGDDFDCGSGLLCSSAGVCQPSARTCQSTSDCQPGQLCAVGVCVAGCQTAGCPEGLICSASLNQCVALAILSGGGGTGSGGTTAGGTTGGQCTPDTWSSFAGTFFQSYCNRCHDWNQQTVSQDPNIGPEIQGRYMPPSSPRPSTADVNRILTWIQCGEP